MLSHTHTCSHTHTHALAHTCSLTHTHTHTQCLSNYSQTQGDSHFWHCVDRSPVQLLFQSRSVLWPRAPSLPLLLSFHPPPPPSPPPPLLLPLPLSSSRGWRHALEESSRGCGGYATLASEIQEAFEGREEEEEEEAAAVRRGRLQVAMGPCGAGSVDWGADGGEAVRVKPALPRGGDDSPPRPHGSVRVAQFKPRQCLPWPPGAHGQVDPLWAPLRRSVWGVAWREPRSSSRSAVSINTTGISGSPLCRRSHLIYWKSTLRLRFFSVTRAQRKPGTLWNYTLFFFQAWKSPGGKNKSQKFCRSPVECVLFICYSTLSMYCGLWDSLLVWIQHVWSWTCGLKSWTPSDPIGQRVCEPGFKTGPAGRPVFLWAAHGAALTLDESVLWPSGFKALQVHLTSVGLNQSDNYIFIIIYIYIYIYIFLVLTTVSLL